MSRIYKILTRSQWRAAKLAGQFGGSEVDVADGYIHFSTSAQAPETARKHFSGQADLVVLEVATEKLGAQLRWEPSRGGELFPHLYGPLPISNVSVVHEAPLDQNGLPTLGPLP